MGLCRSKTNQPREIVTVTSIWDTYEQGELLGDGSFSEVFAAVNRHTQQRVAIKVISPEFKKVFENEVSIMMRLQHDNVTRIIDSVIDQKGFYIIMPLFDGGELFERFIADRHKMNELHVSKLIQQMLHSVQHLHSNDIVHLDLKPENFVFESSNFNSRLKLVDFGSAIAIESETIYESFLASLFYAPPEIIGQYSKCKGNVLKKSDMWAIGVITFTLVTGKSPFKRNIEPLTRQAIYSCEYSFPENVEVSRSLIDFISKLLVSDPMERLSVDDALNHIWITNPRKPSVTLFHPSVLLGMYDLQAESRFKRGVAKLLAKNISPEKRERLEKQFDHLDKDSSGVLGPDEIEEMLVQGLGLRPEIACFKAEAIVNLLDTQSFGGINKDQFIQVHALGELGMNSDAVEQSYQMLTDADADIDLDEKEMIELLDLRKGEDGRISFNGFFMSMQSPSPEVVRKLQSCEIGDWSDSIEEEEEENHELGDKDEEKSK